jgi:hypothetical protein
MKKLLTLVAVLLLAAGSADAGRKREKSGTVDGHVYTDAKHGFQLTADDNWNMKTMDADGSFRLVLTQKKYDIPPMYLSTPDYTKVPRIILWVDTTQMGAFPFIDSLVSKSFKSKQKSEIFTEFEILAEPEVLPRGRTPFTVGNDKGARWDGHAKYMKVVQISASSVGGKRVNGAYSGSILALKHDNLILAFHVISEETFFQTVITEAMKIVNSLTWPAPPPK